MNLPAYPHTRLFVTPVQATFSKKNSPLKKHPNNNDATALKIRPLRSKIKKPVSKMNSSIKSPWLFLGFLLLATCRDAALLDEPDIAQGNLELCAFDSLFIALRYDRVLLLSPGLQANFSEKKDWPNYYAVCNKTALSLWRSHHSDSAAALVRRLLPEASDRLGEHPVIADFYTSLGNANADLRTDNAFQITLHYFQKALDINRKVFGEPSPQVATSYDRFGIAYWLMDEYPASLAEFEKAIVCIGDIRPQNGAIAAEIHSHIGLLYNSMGQHHHALHSFTETHRILCDVLQRRDSEVVKCLKDIAECHLHLGDSDQALTLAREALLLETQVGNAAGKLSCYVLEDIAACQMALGNYDAAISIFQQCLGYWHPDNRDDLNALTIELQNLADAWLKKGRPAEALRCLHQSYALMDTVFDAGSFQRVGVLKRIGEAYLIEKNTRKAEFFFKKALAIALPKVGERHPVIGRLHRKLSEVYALSGMWHRAQQEAEAARTAFCATDPPLREGEPIDASAVNSLPDFIELHDWIGQISTANAFVGARPPGNAAEGASYKQAIAYADSLQRTLLSRVARQALQAQVFSIADHALADLHQRWVQNPQPPLLRDVFFFMEKSKAAGLLAAGRECEARQSAGIPVAWLDREQQLKAALNHLKDLLHPAIVRDNAPATSPDQQARWQQAFFAAHHALDSFLIALEQHFPPYYQLKYNSRIADLDALQELAADQNARVVEFFYGSQTIYALSVSPDKTVSFQKIKNRDAVEAALNDLSHELQHPDPSRQSDAERLAQFQSFCQNAAILYQDLLALPSDKDSTRPEKLIVVPDGPLCRLPFHILLTHSPEAPVTEADYRGLPYLLRHCAVQYESAGTMLLRPHATTVPPSGGYLGFAPDYATNTGFAVQDTAPDIPLWADASRGSFGRLIHNQTEIESVSSLLQGVCLAGQAASETNFKARAGKAAILHLAMHGILDSREPDQSALIFSPDAAASQSDDGRLHAWEIYDMHLSAQLAVLSACQTGAGRWQQGEGAMSLAHAFRYAGCPAVAMSLWEAEDASTATVVTNFFERLKYGAQKSDALREAALHYLSIEQSEVRCHPYFWANLVLTGNDAALVFSEQHYTGGQLAGLVALLLAITGLFYSKASKISCASF